MGDKPAFETFEVQTKLQALKEEGRKGTIKIGNRGISIEFSPVKDLEILIGRIKQMYEDNMFDQNTISVTPGEKID